MSGLPTKPCAYCGSMFARDTRCTWAHWARAKYCSRTCTGAANSIAASAARKTVGEEFVRWFTRSDGCWEWLGARDKDGYGIFSYAGKTYRAPKVALDLDGRPVPQGKLACHHCDNTSCVRPDHLYPGTQVENMADAKRRGRLNAGRKTKVDETAIRAIRVATGTQNEIAAAFGISRANVSLIRSRKTWASVQ